MRLRPILSLFFVMFAGFITIVKAQQSYPYGFDTRPQRGFMPSSDQLMSPIDNIDAVTGKLHLQIPLASLPKRRGGFGFDLDLIYDSHIYNMNVSPGHQTLEQASPTGGWSYNFQNYKFDGEYRPISQCQTISDQP